jgi:hypothetical protein
VNNSMVAAIARMLSGRGQRPPLYFRYGEPKPANVEVAELTPVNRGFGLPCW